MDYKKIIQEDLEKAMKDREELKLSVLRMITAAVVNKEKEKRYKTVSQEPDLSQEDLEKKSLLSEEEFVSLLQSEAKKRKDSVVEYEKGGRKDLAEKESKEIKIIQEYLPEQMPEEEIKKIAKEAIANLGAAGPKDIGREMAESGPKNKGKADGSSVRRIVKGLLY